MLVTMSSDYFIKKVTNRLNIVDYLLISLETRGEMGFDRTICYLKGHFNRSEVTRTQTPSVNAYGQMVIYNEVIHQKQKN